MIPSEAKERTYLYQSISNLIDEDLLCFYNEKFVLVDLEYVSIHVHMLIFSFVCFTVRWSVTRGYFGNTKGLLRNYHKHHKTGTRGLKIVFYFDVFVEFGKNSLGLSALFICDQPLEFLAASGSKFSQLVFLRFLVILVGRTWF